MRIGRRMESWVVGAALLASGEFGYAHVRHMGLWPVEAVSSSIWPLLAANVGAAESRPSFWLAPLGLALVALLVCAVGVRKRGRTTTAPEGGRHHG